MIKPTRLLLFLVVSLTSIATISCASGGPSSGGSTSAPIVNRKIESLGDVMVWYRVYPRTEVHGRESGVTQQRGLDYVLINESHSKFEGRDPSLLRENEYLVPDEVMLKLLTEMQRAGVFDSRNSGAKPVYMRPDQHAKDLYPRPDKWIGIAHKGKYTYMPAVRIQTPTPTLQKRAEIFTDAIRVVQNAQSFHLPKPRVGTGNGGTNAFRDSAGRVLPRPGR